MKIVQSFYQIENNAWYRKNTMSGRDNYLINFYSLLLSYLTIRDLYGGVTMYCNQTAYDKMLKFIPYDDIIIDDYSYINSTNYINEWALLKFNVFEKQKEPFIHIDGDVFIFNDVLGNFINGEEYDAIVQSIDFSVSDYVNFFKKNSHKLIKFGYIDYDKSIESEDKYGEHVAYNNGVVGFKDMGLLKEYIKNAKEYNEYFKSNLFIEGSYNKSLIFEQFNLYHLCLMRDANVAEVLPHDDIVEIGYNGAGNKHGYSHLLAGNKYVGEFVMLVRNKIVDKYPKYIKYIESFEESIIDADIRYLKHRDVTKYM